MLYFMTSSTTPRYAYHNRFQLDKTGLLYIMTNNYPLRLFAVEISLVFESNFTPLPGPVDPFHKNKIVKIKQKKEKKLV